MKHQEKAKVTGGLTVKNTDWNRRETIDWDRLVAIKKRGDYLDDMAIKQQEIEWQLAKEERNGTSRDFYPDRREGTEGVLGADTQSEKESGK